MIKQLFRWGIALKSKLENHPTVGPLLLATYNESLFRNYQLHDRMLADTVRLEVYHEAIQKHVTSSSHVLDLGTGTGILAFFAAQQSPKQVYAIDHNDISIAAKLAKNHHFSIDFRQIHGSKFHERIDVLIHELISSFIFAEGMIHSVLDVRDRCLTNGGRILPNRFRIFLEPVQLKPQYRIPLLWEYEIYGISYDLLQHLDPPTTYYQRLVSTEAVQTILSTPEPIWKFDLETMLLKDVPTSLSHTSLIQHEGYCDGFCLYFEAWFDDDLVLTNAPGEPSTHWQIGFFRIPQLSCHPGERLCIDWQIPNIQRQGSWRWQYVKR